MPRSKRLHCCLSLSPPAASATAATAAATATAAVPKCWQQWQRQQWQQQGGGHDGRVVRKLCVQIVRAVCAGCVCAACPCCFGRLTCICAPKSWQTMAYWGSPERSFQDKLTYCMLLQ
jgi:hypothetical protein